MEKIKLPYIEDNAHISIEIGAFFYQRMKNLIPYILKDEEPEDIIKILTTLKDLSDTEIAKEEQLFHLQTVLIFLKDAEEQFIEKGFIKSQDVEIPKTQD